MQISRVIYESEKVKKEVEKYVIVVVDDDDDDNDDVYWYSETGFVSQPHQNCWSYVVRICRKMSTFFPSLATI